MPWYDVQNIPWLNTNPAEFSLRSAQAAEGIGRNFAQGMRMGMEKRENDALAPLRQRLMEDKQKLGALELSTELSKREDSIAAKSAFAEMATAAAEISNRGAWADPKSEAQIWGIAAKHPAVVNTVEFRNIIGQFDTANKAVIAAKDAETRAQRAADALAIANQQAGLLSTKIELQDAQAKAALADREKDRESREKIAKERDETQVEVASLRAGAVAKDKLNEMGYRAFSEELDNITRDPAKTTEQKRLEIRKLHEQAEKGLYRPNASAPTPGAKPPAASQGGPPVIRTKAERDALPKGTRYIRDGVEYIKE